MNTYLLIVQIVTVIGYLSWIVYLNGSVLHSISESSRLLREKFGKADLRQFLFLAFIINITWPFHATVETGLSFATMAFLIACGVAAKFWKTKSEELVHNIGAGGGIVLALVTVGLFDGWYTWIPAVLQVLFMLLYKGKKNYTFWIETSAIILVIASEIVFI
jgi:hypothetical protein